MMSLREKATTTRCFVLRLDRRLLFEHPLELCLRGRQSSTRRHSILQILLPFILFVCLGSTASVHDLIYVCGHTFTLLEQK